MWVISSVTVRRIKSDFIMQTNCASCVPISFLLLLSSDEMQQCEIQRFDSFSKELHKPKIPPGFLVSITGSESQKGPAFIFLMGPKKALKVCNRKDSGKNDEALLTTVFTGNSQHAISDPVPLVDKNSACPLQHFTVHCYCKNPFILLKPSATQDFMK